MRAGLRRVLVLLAAAVNLALGPAATAPPPPSSTLDRSQLLADTATLSDPALEGRLAASAGGRRARAWIASAFAAIGLQPAGTTEFEQPFSFTIRRLSGLFSPGPFRREYRDSGNVIGRLHGSDPTRPAIVISAHYDHLGVVGGVVYPGADDNASGVAAMLAVARAMKARGSRHSLIFAAFDAEEQGLRGARLFVQSGAPGRFALNINLDMLSRSPRREIQVAGTSHHPQLRHPVEALQATTPVAIRFGHDRPELGSDDWTMLSDHGAFHSERIPFLYFGVEDHEDYHQPTDTFERIDRQFFADVAALVIDAVAALDRAMP
jgi:hypothetical protein